jgi:dCTP deaminase
MILSDKTIRSLCMVPEMYFDEAGYNQYWENGVALPAHVQAAAMERERIRQMFFKPVSQEMKDSFKPMITPFIDGCIRQISIGDVDAEETVKRKVLSYGLSSFGYDVRLSDKFIDGKPPFVIFTNHHSAIIDPKRADSQRDTMALEIHTDSDGAKYVIMPAHTYGMGFTEEVFDIPRDISVVCVGKSTYARSAVFVNVTPIEAGFKGSVVIELGNSSGCPVKIYLAEGVAQFLFFRGNEACETSYADRNGKYQNQRGIVHSKV